MTSVVAYGPTARLIPLVSKLMRAPLGSGTLCFGYRHLLAFSCALIDRTATTGDMPEDTFAGLFLTYETKENVASD